MPELSGENLKVRKKRGHTVFCTDFVLLLWCPQGQGTSSSEFAFSLRKFLFLRGWRCVCVCFFLTRHQHRLLTGTVPPESNRVFFKIAFVLSQPLKHVALEGSIRIDLPCIFRVGAAPSQGSLGGFLTPFLSFISEILYKLYSYLCIFHVSVYSSQCTHNATAK